jgi:hypothetical protein
MKEIVNVFVPAMSSQQIQAIWDRLSDEDKQPYIERAWSKHQVRAIRVRLYFALRVSKHPT